MKSLNFTFLTFTAFGFLLSSCESTSDIAPTTQDVNPNFSIASEEYEKLAETYLKHMEKLETKEMGEMVSDDIIYFLPDGGEEDRTTYEGREKFMDFWESYKEKSGLDHWKITNIVSFPVEALNTLAYSNISGVFSLTYFSMYLKFEKGETNIRANYGFHFNKDKKIDRIYGYYDRTGIIEATGSNVLKD